MLIYNNVLIEAKSFFSVGYSGFVECFLYAKTWLCLIITKNISWQLPFDI